ncbi:Beta-galactosidase [Fulvia fulva]|uniref:Beta-galactosidase n=1 Tax=Passalora fulva TaxID=5499 RepID=A0A9Q8LAW6_PASFU|nr:Beta-galactosidase [Fulvia fulva]KAK4631501.1 Beta-galactosidase [Fulvia fulva]KAK4632816.1 Beta-galactosidase [Fulvia fulva]UJO13388.1 Beta-galactosidase [Fulvia fulva]WPV11968.1 Beta-galactosidase [Fulvia fulva]WPV26851.1 Beta-galactosidase [Fulvia fulva]
MRDTIAKYVPKGSIPAPPANVPMMAVPEIRLEPLVSLADSLPAKVTKDYPVPMEALGQSYGFILCEHTATEASSGILHPGDRPRDRVLVYVNNVRVGIIDSQYQHPNNVSVDLKPGDTLRMLIESLGRVDYYSTGNKYADYLRQPHKGIVGNVTVGSKTMTRWNHYTIPLTELPSTTQAPSYSNNASDAKGQLPQFYHGTFKVPSGMNCTDPAALDPFLSIPAGVRGQVFVNGSNLGRYWLVGPQQSL